MYKSSLHARFPAGRRQRVALALASGVLLALSYLYPWLFALAWVGFVPLLLALRDAGSRESYFLGAVAGLALYAGATYWIVEFIATLKGYGVWRSMALGSLFWVYSAQALGVVALVFTWLKRRSPVPPLVLFSVVVVAVCTAFPTLFPTRLGETQSYFLPAIQAVELTGVYGLDFIVALANAALFGWVAGEAGRTGRKAAAAAGVVVVLWLGYGLYALSEWDARSAAWDGVRVGLVQSNQEPSIAIPPPRPGYSRAYPPEMAVTEDLATAGAELVIWPETRFKGYFKHAHVRRAFHSRLAALETPLLFHDLERVPRAGGRREFNSAVLIDANGRRAGTYRKRQRIAFGEYVPLAGRIPALRAWGKRYFGISGEISAGSGPKVFRAGRVALVPLICYEIAFPVFAAEALAGEPEGKVLVTLSNDGWFGRTRQPYMHGYTSVLRAVENRVPLIHVLNNGPSLVVAPHGRVLLRSDFHVTAGYLVEMPYSPASGGSLFSRYPYGFIATLYGVLALIAVPAAASRFRRVGGPTRGKPVRTRRAARLR